MNNINNRYPHVLDKVKKILELSDEERIYFLREEKWINYPLASDILDKMDTLIKYPRKSRMPNMLLVGETNNGKTSIINRFLQKNPPIRNHENVETTKIPVTAIQAPLNANLSDFYSSILKQFAVPYRNTDKTAKKQQQIEHYFNLCGLKILIIDEIHNILGAPIARQTMFMNALKTMSNDLKISIVLAGIKDALHATNTNNQISNRFKPVFLTKWQLSRDYLSLLASIEMTLPLRQRSNIAQNKEIAHKILDLSEGYIGEMLDLLISASEYAINNKIEKVTIECIKKSGFVKPSLRKNFEDMVQL